VSSHSFFHYSFINSLKRMVVFACFWGLLSQNQGWAFGILFILLATWCTYKTDLHFPSLRWRHLPGFMLFFLQRLVAGGIGVAIRTLSKTPAISPTWAVYEFRSASAEVCLTLSAIVGLLPGTLAAKAGKNVMRVHVLDAGHDWRTDIEQLETRLIKLLTTPSLQNREQV
jgi:multicomponent Na+:H+ antiporter subunit E